MEANTDGAPDAGVDELARRLLRARHVLVLSGAGLSAASGIPTFRDAMTGLWARYRPEELATPEAFAANPRRVWDWYASRRAAVARARPNAAHEALARLQRVLGTLTLVTQNVDGLLQAAGARRVVELHGNILRSVCSVTRRPIEAAWIDEHGGRPPPSPHHPDGLARPDVVWFGEALPGKALDAAFGAAEACDLCLVVGTSSVVEPAASLPRVAAGRGVAVVEINPEATPLSPLANLVLRAPADRALPRAADVVERLFTARNGAAPV